MVCNNGKAICIKIFNVKKNKKSLGIYGLNLLRVLECCQLYFGFYFPLKNTKSGVKLAIITHKDGYTEKEHWRG